jgi:hypothetical protein
VTLTQKPFLIILVLLRELRWLLLETLLFEVKNWIRSGTESIPLSFLQFKCIKLLIIEELMIVPAVGQGSPPLQLLLFFGTRPPSHASSRLTRVQGLSIVLINVVGENLLAFSLSNIN